MAQDHVLSHQKEIPMFWTWHFPLFRPLKSDIIVKELLLSNSQSKSCKSAKFWVIVGFQVQV